MLTTKLSSKGRIIIPKEIRNRHHWVPGQELQAIDTDDGVLLRQDKNARRDEKCNQKGVRSMKPERC